jgi:hypothetical protein
MKSVVKQLLSLQVQQLEHDELFHKEITRLNVHQRLNHMALHFAKYSGKVCDYVLNASDDQNLRKIIIDSFIISTTCANILNIRLSDKLLTADADQCHSLHDLGHVIANRFGLNVDDPLWLLKTYPIVVGQLAKACESVDHLEPYAYRESITDYVVRICSLMLVAASHLQIDLASAIPLRLTEVKKKSIFFNHYTSR